MSKNFFVACAVFVVVFTVYLFTLAPTIYIEDSAEYITAAATLGIAHPSGYPLYILLGKLFTFIPLGTIAWRVNLMSAVFGALTCSLLYLITRNLTKSHIIGVFCGLVLGFSEIFWSQSVIAEVYTLNAFFSALVLYLLILWTQKRDEKYLLWFSFLFGLGITNHEMLGLQAPVFLVYILLVDRGFWKKWRLIIKMVFLFFLGLSVYLYLPWRSRQNPALDWGNPETLRGLWKHLTRKMYNDVSLSGRLTGKFGMAVGFLLELAEQFYLPTILLAAGGFYYLVRKSRPFAFLTLGFFLSGGLGVIFLRNIGWSFYADYTYRVYYLPVYLILLVWVGITVRYLFQILNRLVRHAGLRFFTILIVIISLLAVPTGLLVKNYRINDLSDFWLVYDYGYQTFNSLKPNSLLLLKGNGYDFDTITFSFLYFQLVENLRPDVTILDLLNLFYQKATIEVPGDKYAKMKPEEQQEDAAKFVWNAAKDNQFSAFYTNFPVDTEADEKTPALYSRSNGFLYQVYSSQKEAKSASSTGQIPILRNLNNEEQYQGYGFNEFMTYLYYNWSSFYLEAGRPTFAAYFRNKAIKADNTPQSFNYFNYRRHRDVWRGIGE